MHTCKQLGWLPTLPAKNHLSLIFHYYFQNHLWSSIWNSSSPEQCLRLPCPKEIIQLQQKQTILSFPRLILTFLPETYIQEISSVINPLLICIWVAWSRRFLNYSNPEVLKMKSFWSGNIIHWKQLFLRQEQFKLIFWSRKKNNSEIFMRWNFGILKMNFFFIVHTGIINTELSVSFWHLMVCKRLALVKDAY